LLGDGGAPDDGDEEEFDNVIDLVKLFKYRFR
jgi:hypothetical protein